MNKLIKSGSQSLAQLCQKSEIAAEFGFTIKLAREQDWEYVSSSELDKTTILKFKYDFLSSVNGIVEVEDDKIKDIRVEWIPTEEFEELQPKIVYIEPKPEVSENSEEDDHQCDCEPKCENCKCHRENIDEEDVNYDRKQLEELLDKSAEQLDIEALNIKQLKKDVSKWYSDYYSEMDATDSSQQLKESFNKKSAKTIKFSDFCFFTENNRFMIHREEPTIRFIITPKHLWNSQEKICDISTFDVAANKIGFSRECESQYSFNGEVNQGVKLLIDLGVEDVRCPAEHCPCFDEQPISYKEYYKKNPQAYKDNIQDIKNNIQAWLNDEYYTHANEFGGGERESVEETIKVCYGIDIKIQSMKEFDLKLTASDFVFWIDREHYIEDFEYEGQGGSDCFVICPKYYYENVYKVNGEEDGCSESAIIFQHVQDSTFDISFEDGSGFWFNGGTRWGSKVLQDIGIKKVPIRKETK